MDVGIPYCVYFHPLMFPLERERETEGKKKEKEKKKHLFFFHSAVSCLSAFVINKAIKNVHVLPGVKREAEGSAGRRRHSSLH